MNRKQMLNRLNKIMGYGGDSNTLPDYLKGDGVFILMDKLFGLVGRCEAKTESGIHYKVREDTSLAFFNRVIITYGPVGIDDTCEFVYDAVAQEHSINYPDSDVSELTVALALLIIEVVEEINTNFKTKHNDTADECIYCGHTWRGDKKDGSFHFKSCVVLQTGLESALSYKHTWE